MAVFLRPIPTLLFCLAAALHLPVAVAHEGEDHAAPATPSPAASPATEALVAGGPRASAATDAFEAVAVLQPGQVLFYIDRYDSNAPVTGAVVDVEGAAVSGRAKETAPGVYVLPLSGALPVPVLAPGAHALTLTVETADTADLLALSLVVPTADVAATPTGNTTSIAIAVAVVLALLGGLGVWWYAARRRGVSV